MEPYIGEIRMAAIDFAPVGWMICDGTILQIAENTTLYSLIGNAYGGDGQTNFALPDLRGRVPVRAGGTYPLGAAGGSDTVVLDANTMPQHSHLAVVVEQPASLVIPGPDTILAQEFCTAQGGATAVSTYALPGGSQTALAAKAIMPTGGGEPHENRQPYLTINFIIAINGIYPAS